MIYHPPEKTVGWWIMSPSHAPLKTQWGTTAKPFWFHRWMWRVFFGVRWVPV